MIWPFNLFKKKKKIESTLDGSGGGGGGAHTGGSVGLGGRGECIVTSYVPGSLDDFGGVGGRTYIRVGGGGGGGSGGTEEERIRNPTQEEIEMFIKAAELDLGCNSTLGWVKGCARILREWEYTQRIKSTIQDETTCN